MTAGELTEFLDGAFPRQAGSHSVVEVSDRGVIMHFPIGPHHERPGGTVSGPTLMSIADSSAWMATLSRIGPVALAVTSSLNINFLRKPALDQDLWAHADLVRLGRRTSVTDVRIHSGPDPEPVAQATVTYAIPTG
jgi:uncharacterized protein (TIGR00369 family)